MILLFRLIHNYLLLRTVRLLNYEPCFRSIKNYRLNIKITGGSSINWITGILEMKSSQYGLNILGCTRTTMINTKRVY
jgi:hypothetical protein